jgi:hypothetical protein
MVDIINSKINRIILHKVHPKENDGAAKVEYENEIFTFGAEELKSLQERIQTAFGKDKRFFKLNIEKSDDKSFYHYATKIKGTNNTDFIKHSKNIARLLANSHDKRTIPGGFLILIEGLDEKNNFFIMVIKAEVQEALTISEASKNRKVQLIKNLFLSGGKEFYKIGYIKENPGKKKDINEQYSCYMYDDQFSSGKRDLAEYFYKVFLGLTTDKNAKLITKQFYLDVCKVIDKNEPNYDNRRGLRNAISALYREDTRLVIHPKEFSDHNLEGKVKEAFKKEITPKYPNSFEKDLTLVDSKLKRIKLKIDDDLTLEGPTGTLDGVKVYKKGDADFGTLQLSLNSGEIDTIITINTSTKEKSK